MENKYEYENNVPYAASSTTTIELEEERKRGEIPVGTGEGFQPRENAAVFIILYGLVFIIRDGEKKTFLDRLHDH